MKRYLIPAVALIALSSSASAAVIYSGLRDILVPFSLDGVYLNLNTGITSTTAPPEWSLNAFFGGEAFGNTAPFQPVRLTTNPGSAILNLPSNTVVDLSSTIASGFGSSSTHVGLAANQFQNGTEGYLGFAFTPTSATEPLYGWMRVVLNNDGNPGLIRDWALESSGTGISVGAIPEPSSLLVALTGMTLLAFRRKRVMR